MPSRQIRIAVPVRPPAAARRCRSVRGARRGASAITSNGDDGDRHAPDHEAPLPAAADQRQHQRQHQRNGEDFADQQAVGVDGGGKADALRQPGAHRRRHGHLHDGDAGAHRDGHGIEPGHVGHRAAQCAADRGDGEPNHQGRAHAEAGDQQRAGHRGEREQHRGQAGENADLGRVQLEFVVDERNDRRHRQNGQPQAGAGEPQQQQRREKASLRPRLTGVLHCRNRHCGEHATETAKCPLLSPEKFYVLTAGICYRSACNIALISAVQRTGFIRFPAIIRPQRGRASLRSGELPNTARRLCRPTIGGCYGQRS